MKKYTFITSFIIAGLLPQISFSQLKNIAPFDSTWYGFATGKFPQGQSPSPVKAADIDNDGDQDVVVAQENFSNPRTYYGTQTTLKD